MKLSRFGYALVWTAISFFSLTSCSDDDNEPEELIYHQSYVKGKVNGEDVFMNYVNATILSENTMYDFTPQQGDIPGKFDWQVKLLETKDSIVTLYLHIDNIEMTNAVIYSPNDQDQIRTPNTCYVTVEDLNKKVTKVYHPTHPSPVFARWRVFKVTAEAKRQEQAQWADNGRMKGINVEYAGYWWQGIDGKVEATLTCDDAVPNTIKVDIDFRLY